MIQISSRNTFQRISRSSRSRSVVFVEVRVSGREQHLQDGVDVVVVLAVGQVCRNIDDAVKDLTRMLLLLQDAQITETASPKFGLEMMVAGLRMVVSVLRWHRLVQLLKVVLLRLLVPALGVVSGDSAEDQVGGRDHLSFELADSFLVEFDVSGFGDRQTNDEEKKRNAREDKK